jgi:enoyl-CoA hydratase
MTSPTPLAPSLSLPSFKYLELEYTEHILKASIARESKANAIHETLWFELEKLALWVDESPEIRVLILNGKGKHFTAGIDFSLALSLFTSVSTLPEGHKQEAMYHKILKLQKAFTAFEKCRKPVLTAIHGSCLGAGIDLITACDLRYASADAYFCIKEIDLAIVADIGTLQRLPHLIGQGHTRELALTGRTFSAQEAKDLGLVNNVYPTSDELISKYMQSLKRLPKNHL